MLMKHTSQARLTTVACFPKHSFLENLAVRADNSILVSVLNRKDCGTFHRRPQTCRSNRC